MASRRNSLAFAQVPLAAKAQLGDQPLRRQILGEDQRDATVHRSRAEQMVKHGHDRSDAKPIGHDDFEPFFAAAEAADMPIFVHPLRPAGMERLVGPAVLEQMVAFPCETGLAIASLMTGGILARHPRRRMAFSHGGGTFALMLARLQLAWSMVPSLQKPMPRSPRDLARTLYYDTLVYDRAALRFVIDQFGSDQVLIGTDYPFAIMERAPVDRLREADLASDALAKIAATNARRFLGEE